MNRRKNITLKKPSGFSDGTRRRIARKVKSKKLLSRRMKQLPLNLFEYEWEKLGKGNDPKLYKKLSNVEKIIPCVFGSLFFLVILLEIKNMIPVYL